MILGRTAVLLIMEYSLTYYESAQILKNLLAALCHAYVAHLLENLRHSERTCGNAAVVLQLLHQLTFRSTLYIVYLLIY